MLLVQVIPEDRVEKGIDLGLVRDLVILRVKGLVMAYGIVRWNLPIGQVGSATAVGLQERLVIHA